METKITATELARNLSDILNRTRYKGERFIVERNGEPVAIIKSPPKKHLSVEELVELWKSLPRPDDKFADDLEKIQASQPPAEVREWPS